MATEPFGLATRGLAIPEHDWIRYTETNGLITEVIFKSGGENGTTVATLTATYSGNTVTIAKS